MEKINVAIVGVSGFGNIHYADIMRAYRAGRVRIACATIVNQEEEAEKCGVLRQAGCEVFRNANDMFRHYAGKVDVCFLPVGIGLHAPLSIAAMKSGMNVFVEKPLTATVQEADEIIAASKETGRFVAVGYQHLYQPQVHAVKRAILGGEIGKIQTVKGIGLWARGRAYYTRNNWAGKLQTDNGWILDSPVNNALAHYLNLVCYFGGTTPNEMAEVATLEASLYRANPEIESFDTAFLKMKSTDGLDLLFMTSHVAQENLEPRIEIIGDGGRVTWTQESYTVSIPGTPDKQVKMPSEEEIRDNIMEAVLNRVHDQNALVVTPERAAVLTRIVNASHSYTPIVPVPKDYVSMVTGSSPDDVRRVWNGLDEIIRRTYEEGRMPTVSDFPFCWSGAPRRPSDLKRFEGTFDER